MPSIVRHAISASIRLQSKLNERLRETLASQRDRSDLFAAWIIVLCSFAYGVLHALGPGHSRPAVELPRRERPERPTTCRVEPVPQWPVLESSRRSNVHLRALANGRTWPAVRIHPPRRKAAVDYSNVGYVERPRNWCSRPIEVTGPCIVTGIRTSASQQMADIVTSIQYRSRFTKNLF
jgi:hypothetical protein